MTLGMFFWLTMFLWLFFGFGWSWRVGPDSNSRATFGGNLALIIVLLLLGWKVFGSMITGN